MQDDGLPAIDAVPRHQGSTLNQRHNDLAGSCGFTSNLSLVVPTPALMQLLRWLNSSAMPQMIVCLLPHLPYILVAVECLRIGFASSFVFATACFFITASSSLTGQSGAAAFAES